MSFFLFTITFRLALGPTLSLVQWVPGCLSPGIKQLEHEADHLLPSNFEVKNAWIYASPPPYIFMAWCFIK
jgi:hypothetical protein